MKHALRSAVILLVLGATPALLAQISTGGMGVAGGSHMGGAIGHGGLGAGRGVGFRPARPGVVGGFHHHGFRNSNRFFSPFWSTGFWWDDGYAGTGDQVVVEQPAPVVVQQAAPVQEVKPANPLLIELQGDRFVRLTRNDVNPPVAAGTAQPVAPEHAELPPAVLVFRDGHRQEVSSYSIVGPALYASGSYWTNGYWTQKILLADLNLPATFEANQERGVNFVLPSSPDQVITRP